ncbi:MAG: hypothetical protein JW927_17880 [Deltaproteobacteria bacterium]|nr:hypothetical protein [Deltaproteobacteria bacterium]
MSSNSKQTTIIRKNKVKANKPNLKADRKRDQQNREVLKELAEKDKK